MTRNPKTIKKNISRRSKIVDDTVSTFKKYPKSLGRIKFGVCIRSCSFCPNQMHPALILQM